MSSISDMVKASNRGESTAAIMGTMISPPPGGFATSMKGNGSENGDGLSEITGSFTHFIAHPLDTIGDFGGKLLGAGGGAVNQAITPVTNLASTIVNDAQDDIKQAMNIGGGLVNKVSDIPGGIINTAQLIVLGIGGVLIYTVMNARSVGEGVARIRYG